MDEKFYFAFEEKFRGSSDDIVERLRVYLPFLIPIANSPLEPAAIDLGCGRGEWLQLMREVGISATGIDHSKSMVEHCIDIDLTASHGDALQALESLPQESLNMVSGFHLAEHVSFETLKRLIDESLRVLAPGGLLILETPNPENLSVGACQFYLDPTHERPIPPALLAFLSEYVGFFRSKILRLQEPHQLHEKLTPSIGDIIYRASPDYALVAQKFAHPTLLASFDEAFDQPFGLTPDVLAARFQGAIDGIPDLADTLTATQHALHQTHQEVLHLIEQMKEFQSRLDASEDRAESASAALAAITSSWSWWLTRPIRAVAGAFRVRR